MKRTLKTLIPLLLVLSFLLTGCSLMQTPGDAPDDFDLTLITEDGTAQAESGDIGVGTDISADAADAQTPAEDAPDGGAVGIAVEEGAAPADSAGGETTPGYDPADSEPEEPSGTEEAGSGSQEGTPVSAPQDADTQAEAPEDFSVTEDGEYTSKEEVAEYIHLYGHLPGNFISKYDAQELGWNSSKGNLWDAAPGKSIGGDKFGNYEGNLPAKKGRKYYECDIDYQGGYRDAKRIVYSNDGLVYYTEDHYEHFELLYGEE